MSSNLVFFYTSNYRSIALETQILQLRKIGFDVHVITLAPWGDLHDYLQSLDFRISVLPGVGGKGFLRYLVGAYKLSLCVHQDRARLVISHLQAANLIACIAYCWPFNNFQLITFRHHDSSTNRNSLVGDKIINILSPRQVVPSLSIATRMVSGEKVQKQRIYVLKYAYDFSKYLCPSSDAVSRIRVKYGYPLLIVISRMVPEKRHDLVIDAISILVKNGYKLSCVFLDTGSEVQSLIEKVRNSNLENSIHFTGFVRNVLDYLSAADVLVHPSVAEASCSAVKEAGLFSIPVIACSGVGDFDEYLRDNFNSCLLPTNSGSLEWASKIEILIKEPIKGHFLAGNLHETVLHEFSDSTIALDNLRQLLSIQS